MKIFKVLYPVINLLLIPLWIGLITEFIKQKPWLLYTAIAITTVMILAVIARVAFEFITIFELSDKLKRFRIDSLIRRTHKKIKKTIAAANNISSIDYTINKIREMYSHDTYSAVLDEMIVKEKNQYKKNTLQNYKIKLETKNENKKN